MPTQILLILKSLVLIDVKNGGADVENVDEDSICDYYLTPCQFYSLARVELFLL